MERTTGGGEARDSWGPVWRGMIGCSCGEKWVVCGEWLDGMHSSGVIELALHQKPRLG